MTRTTRQLALVICGLSVGALGARATAQSVNEDWTARYAGVDDAQAVDIDVDPQGNVYITGWCYRVVGGDTDYLTIKYSPGGAELWAIPYDSPDHGSDKARAIDVDSQGNVYVTGESAGDCVTLKYDTNGNGAWMKSIENACGNDIQVERIGEGNVVVTGQSGSNCLAVRYLASNGQPIWTNTSIEGEGNALAITVGSQFAYVAGWIIGPLLTTDYLVVQYDFSSGAVKWWRLWDNYGYDEAHDVVVDLQANVYVTGESNNGALGRDVVTRSWDVNAGLRWTSFYNGAGNWTDIGYAIGICDDYGHIRVGGYATGAAFMSELLVIKYDSSSGDEMWSETYAGPDGLSAEARDLAVDDDGNVYLTGFTDNASGNYDYLTVKYDTVGDLMWAMTHGGPYQDDQAAAIAIGQTIDDDAFVPWPPDCVYITGYDQEQPSDEDCLTIQYSQGGPITGVRYSDAQWGDIDNDGDLDLVICGEANDASVITEIYENQGGVLVLHQSLTGVKSTGSGCLAWGDYDGDGDLDLTLAGMTGAGVRIARIYENEGLASGNFTHDTQQVLTGVGAAALAWGDYDNDGDLDLVITGADGTERQAILYENDPPGMLASDPNATLTGLSGGSADWADYDNDGDMDLLLTGHDGTNRRIIFYENDPVGTLSNDGNHGMAGVDLSDAAFGDYDNDGDMDLACTGCTATGGPNIAVICQNDGEGNFAQLTQLRAVYRSSVAWGDYDNDGDLDIASCGYTGTSLYTEIWENTGAGFNQAFSFAGRYEGSVSWADVDGDGDLDSFVTGYDWFTAYSELYQNRASTANSAPAAPTNLTCSGTCCELKMGWTGATDAETPAAGLYYCLRVGTTSGAHDVASGTYGTPLMGNVQQMGNPNVTARLAISLPMGTYYWSVRSIDTGFLASPWSDEQVTVVIDPDFDDDGDVDTADLLHLLGAWGSPDGDVDGDGDTDTADLLALLGAWGQCP